MNEPATVYLEIASVFGEQLAFEELRRRMMASGDREALLALTCKRIDDLIDTMVRQISFSNFERRVHGAGRMLSAEEKGVFWMESTWEMYGPPGEVFTYDHVERLWSYVPHFHDPFYCFSYSFGETFAHSLLALRDALGDRFEPLYLDMLRSGSTRDATELLAPFGLDPASSTFWSNGIRAGLGRLVEEAEALAK